MAAVSMATRTIMRKLTLKNIKILVPTHFHQVSYESIAL